MAKKLPEMLGASGVGDLTGIINNQSVSDLRWLDVDPEEYAKLEALPKQNLDMIPDLHEFLSNEPKSNTPQMVPQRPITVVNSNPLERQDSNSRASVVEDLKNKVASMVLSSTPLPEIKRKLQLEYSSAQIREASESLKGIIDDRGLLGNVYVNADHFPKCYNPKDSSHALVSRYASGAKFVLAKSGCTGCVCNKSGVCSSFKKRIVSSVPYDRTTLASYAGGLISSNRLARGRLDTIPSNSGEIRTMLKTAFLSPPSHKSPEVPKVAHYQPKVAKPEVSDDDIQNFINRRKEALNKVPLPSVHVLKAVASLTRGGLPDGLRASSDSSVRSAAKEYGIVGHTYLDVDALGGPKATLQIITARGFNPDFVVLRQNYEVSSELIELTSKYVVHSVRPPMDGHNLKLALKRSVEQKRMDMEMARGILDKVSSHQRVDFDALVSQINLYKPKSAKSVKEYTASRATLHHGTTGKSEFDPSPIVPIEVYRTVSHLMNVGLAGDRLRKAILSKYAAIDLKQVPEVGHALASEDGIQGFYYIDPTAYSDYGVCSQGSTNLKHSKVACVKAGNKCTGCSRQTSPGWCSKYAKNLIREVPDQIRREASSRRNLPVLMDSAPITNPVTEFQLASGVDSMLSLNPHKPRTKSVDITVNSPSID